MVVLSSSEYLANSDNVQFYFGYSDFGHAMLEHHDEVHSGEFSKLLIYL